jgi:GT2 family glycosyltransferase/SAM-dependent methyltransferase
MSSDTLQLIESESPGGQPALVTVMIRSMRRASLADALDSVEQQTDPQVEVLVVNAAGGHHPVPHLASDRLSLRLANQDGPPLSRPKAANLAIDQSRGAFLLFLDDDDLISPDHIARLRAALQAMPEAVAAYAGVQLLSADGRTVGQLDEPFDGTRLWAANYLPMHAVMFRREACVAAGVRFDEALPVYEDWDFWRQLSMTGPFEHVPGVSATYRLIGNSGLTNDPSESITREGRAAFYRKWLPRMDSDMLDRLATLAELSRGRLAAESELRASLQAQLGTASQTIAGLEQERRDSAALLQATIRGHEQATRVHDMEVARLHAELRDAAAAMASVQAEAAAAVTALQSEQVRLQSRIDATLDEYRRLESGYRQVTASLSWRITTPLRVVRSAFSAQGARVLVRRLVQSVPASPATKQRAKVWLATRGPLAVRLLRWLAPSSTPLPAAGAVPAPPRSALDKEAVRAQAESELGDFLAGTTRLKLGTGLAATASDGAGESVVAPRVSVVVVLYNQAGLSLLCLKALAASTGVSFETIIVDNASSDRMPQLLDRIDGARILRQDSNLGFLRAVNLAAEHASGEHLLLLNNDAVVEPATLAHAVARLGAEPGVGAVGGPILLWDGRLQEAGSIIWRDGSCLGYGRGDSPDLPAYRFVRDVDYCSGAFLMVRRALFEQLGRFDEVFAPAYYEESDFCVRLWEAGHRIVFDPAVRVKHFEFASDVGSGRAIELQTRNRALLVARHPDFLSQRPVPDGAAVLLARHRLPAGAKRVLVIDDRVPLPWLGQGYPRAASMVAAIVAGGDFVTHYPLQFPGERAEDVARALPETVEVMLDMGLARLAEFMAERAGCYDVMIVSRPHNMEVVRAMLRHAPKAWRNVRVVYDAEALFSLRDIAKAAVHGHPLPIEEQQRRIAAEMALAEGADAIVTVSEVEADHYRASGYGDVRVLGHTVEVKPCHARFDDRRGFLFVGAMTADDTPNADSLLWFVEQVWPIIVAAMGDEALLDIVGACDAPAVRALAGPSIRVRGALVDLEPCFEAARVFIVPTRYAAGIPHKAHEAAARGLPMVVTPLIAGQLGWSDLLEVGDTAEAFAQGCLTLHRSAGAWAEARACLLAAVQRDCDPAAFGRQVQSILGRGAEAPAPDCAPAGPADPVPEAATDHQQRLAALRLLDHSPGRPEAMAQDTIAPEGSARTADLWGRDARARLQAVNVYRHWTSHPTTAREINTLVSGDPEVGWMQHLKRAYFATPAKCGISLGSGSGAVVVDAVRLGIVERMEGLDISPEAVAVANERALQAGLNDRASFRVADLNESRLSGQYQLVMFEQSLHHVDRLDDVLDQCRDVLAPDGLFVFNEYVGPDRFQWSDEAQRLMDSILRILPESHRTDPVSGFVKTAMVRATVDQVIAVDPSEAIHSASIPAACSARFDLVEKRAFGGTLLQFMLADIIANFDPDDARDAALLRLLTLLEKELIEAGTIASDFVFAVYRHRSPQARAAE